MRIIANGYEQDAVTWDGKNFAAVQVLLRQSRVNGEPACRVPSGETTFEHMEVRSGTLPEGAGSWVPVRPGQLVAVNDGGVVSVHG